MQFLVTATAVTTAPSHNKSNVPQRLAPITDAAHNA